MPGAPHIPGRLEPFNTAGKPVSRRIVIANSMFDVPEYPLSLHDCVSVSGVMGERQDACERGACTLELSLRVRHCSRSEERSRLGSWRKSREVQNLFIPVAAFCF